MAFDYSKLRGKIKEVFGTQDKFAKALGISGATLSLKLNNISEFTQQEMAASMRLLHEPTRSVDKYFFLPLWFGKPNRRVSRKENESMSDLIPIEYRAERVLTTEQLAQNFLNNKNHFEEGKHFFKLEGDALKNLRLENIELQISPKARCLYLWTRRGASRHSKTPKVTGKGQVYFINKFLNGSKAVLE